MRRNAVTQVLLTSLALGISASCFAALDLAGVVGFRVNSPPNGQASMLASASLCGNGWSLEGSASLDVLPGLDARSSLAFSVERGGLTLTSKGTFAGTDAQYESVTVGLDGLSTSLILREANPQIELDVSAKLGAVVIPVASPYATLAATLSVDEHWVRFGPSPAVSGSISLYHRSEGDGDVEEGLWVSTLFLADIVPCRLSQVALDARLDLGHAVIMGTILHSHSIPLSLGSSIRTVADALSLSVSAAYVPGGAMPFRFSTQVEYEWYAF